MWTENSHDGPADPPAGAPIELVGRRTPDGPEVYALSPDGVELLHSPDRYGSGRLDWTDSHLSMLELSHAVLVRVAGLHPSLQLATLFAADIIARLPQAGWVLDARAVWRWIEVMSIPQDWSPVDAPDEFAGRRRRGPFTGRGRGTW